MRAARADAEGLVDVVYRTMDSPAGTLLLAATDAGVVKVGFESDDDALGELAARISPRVLQRPARLDETVRQLEEYFAGRRREFELPLDLRLAHGFRRHVLDELRDVGYGTTVSYSELAQAAGNRASGAGRRIGVRDEPHPDRHPVPSRAAQRRLTWWLRRRAARQAGIARSGAASRG